MKNINKKQTLNEETARMSKLAGLNEYYTFPHENGTMSLKDCLPCLKKIKQELDVPFGQTGIVHQWFDNNGINYNGMSNLDMLITYIENDGYKKTENDEESSDLDENKTEQKIYAKKYIDDLIKRHGNDQQVIHKTIVNNYVNSKYGRHSNSEVDAVWKAYNEKFPS